MQILPELQLQNLDQTLCSKSEQKFSLLTKPQRRNLQQIVAKMILIKNSYNLNKFELASSHARATSIKSTKQDSVRELISDKGGQWSDSGPIKTTGRCKLTLSKVFLFFLCLLY